METLDSKVKLLTEENEELKKENTKLINNIHLLKIEVCEKLIDSLKTK